MASAATARKKSHGWNCARNPLKYKHGSSMVRRLLSSFADGQCDPALRTLRQQRRDLPYRARTVRSDDVSSVRRSRPGRIQSSRSPGYPRPDRSISPTVQDQAPRPTLTRDIRQSWRSRIFFVVERPALPAREPVDRRPVVSRDRAAEHQRLRTAGAEQLPVRGSRLGWPVRVRHVESPSTAPSASAVVVQRQSLRRARLKQDRTGPELGLLGETRTDGTGISETAEE
jgi:hypothetical protein